MYYVKITYKDADLVEDWFKDIGKIFREPNENTLTLIGINNSTLINLPYDNIKYYHVFKAEEEKKEDVDPYSTNIVEPINVPVPEEKKAKKGNTINA